MNYSKIKNEILKEQKELKEQERLHDIHKDIDKDVYIVEKPSLVKFLIKLGISFSRTILNILFITLSIMGLISLIYPEIRKELFIKLNLILQEVLSLLGISL